MRASHTILPASALALALAACQPTAQNTTPLGDSAGSAGPEYCETVPSNPDDMEQWNELCGDQGRR